jgi:TonB family protein
VNPHGRPFRRTVLIVVGLHVGLLLFVGLPFASCHKPPTIQPVEIIDLGSLRPGPGLPSPASSSSQPTPSQPPSEIPNQESKIQNPPPQSSPAEEPEPTPTLPTPEPKPEPKPSPKTEPTPLPVTKPVPTPQPETPAKHQVKVSTTKKKVSISSTSPAESKTSSPKSTAPAGPTASDIKNRLASKLPAEEGGGGGDGAGNAGRPDGVADDFSWYRALIKQSIQSAWKKPPIPAGEKIYTEVEIKIAFDGSVTFIKLSRPSGDPAMDASVEQAVRSTPRLAKPLPSGLGSPDYIVIIQFKLE